MPTPVTLIPGDGIGPSTADATVRVLEAAGADIEWDRQVAGQAGVAAHGDPIPEPTLASIRRTKIALKGQHGGWGWANSMPPLHTAMWRLNR